MRRLIPVIEVGGTHLEVAQVDVLNGRVVASTRRRQALDAAGSAEEIIASLLMSASGLNAGSAAWWGIAIPGPFDYERGIGRFAGIGKFESLHGVALAGALQRQLEPAPGGIAFINDADAFLLGEWTRGAASGHYRAVGITLGTGVGSSFLIDGALVHGGPGIPRGGQAWTLSHGGAPLEETVSRRGILARYAAEGGSSEARDVRDVANRARNGEATARRVLEQTFNILGAVLAPWLCEFGANVLVVGGGIARSWELIAPPLSNGLVTTSPDLSSALTITPAAHPKSSALLGAAVCADSASRGGTYSSS